MDPPAAAIEQVASKHLRVARMVALACLAVVMRTRFPLGLAVAAFLVLSLPFQAFASNEGTEQSVVGGGTDGYYAGVVALLSADGTLYCSGVIVGPQLVLTAAHCLETPIALVRISPTISTSTADWNIVDAAAHDRYQGKARGSDLGLLMVDRPLPGFDYRLPQTAGWGDYSEIDVVGFGRREALAEGSGGVQSQRRTFVSTVSARRFHHGESSCYGDSGGAVFDRSGDTPRLIGIVSAGAADCTGESSAVRVDAHLDWLWRNLQSVRTNLCLYIEGGCNTVVGSCSASGQSGRSNGLLLLLAVLLVPLWKHQRAGHC